MLQIQLTKPAEARGLLVVIFRLNEVHTGTIQLPNVEAGIIEPRPWTEQRRTCGGRLLLQYIKRVGANAAVVSRYHHMAGITKVEARKGGVQALIYIGIEAPQQTNFTTLGFVGSFIGVGKGSFILGVFVQHNAGAARAESTKRKLSRHAALRSGAGAEQVMPRIVEHQIPILRKRIHAHNLVFAGVAPQQLSAGFIHRADEQVHAGQLGLRQHQFQGQGIGASIVSEKLQRAAGALQAVLGQAQAGIEVGYELVFALGLPAGVVQLEGQQHGHVVAGLFRGARARRVASPIEVKLRNELIELGAVGVDVDASGYEALGVGPRQGRIVGVAPQQPQPSAALFEAGQISGFHGLALGQQLIGGQQSEGLEGGVKILLLERNLALQKKRVG